MKRNLLLTIDVGNSNIVLGVYDNKEMLYHWRLKTDRRDTEDEYGIKLKVSSCRKILR